MNFLQFPEIENESNNNNNNNNNNGNEETSSVVLSGGATNSSLDVIAYDSKLRDYVEFQPSQAVKSLEKSNSFYKLNDNNPYMLFLLDIDRQIESISFVTEGEGKIGVELTDSTNNYMLNVSTVVAV